MLGPVSRKIEIKWNILSMPNFRLEMRIRAAKKHFMSREHLLSLVEFGKGNARVG